MKSEIQSEPNIKSKQKTKASDKLSADETLTLLDNDIPEKFRDPETGELRFDTLLSSYKALEKKMSQTSRPPQSPEEYCIDCAHGLFVPDEAVNKKLHAMGLTHEQAQGVYDLAAEKLVPMIMEVAYDFRADREIEKLIAHYGGEYSWKEIARQLLAFGRKNLPADVLDSLSSSFDGVLALERMMKSGEPTLKAPKSPVTSGSMAEKELQSMMRDPKYWRDKDPAFVTKVTEGFKSLYGE